MKRLSAKDHTPLDRFLRLAGCDQHLLIGTYITVVDALFFVQLYHPEMPNDEKASLMLSAIFGEPEVQDVSKHDANHDDLCTTCGHTRKHHCGCGKTCLAPTTDPPTPAYYTDEEVDWWISWWRDETPVAISKLLSNPQRSKRVRRVPRASCSR